MTRFFLETACKRKGPRNLRNPLNSLEDGSLFSAPGLLGEILAENRDLVEGLTGDYKVMAQARVAFRIIEGFLGGEDEKTIRRLAEELPPRSPGKIKKLTEPQSTEGDQSH